MTGKKVVDLDKVVATENSVLLRGRLSVVPEERVLPSGDSMWSFRVVVPRTGRARERAPVDSIECGAWSGGVRRSVASWRAGDEVEVRGSLRRRFFSAGGSRVSRFEVEVSSGRLIRRARA